MSASVVTRDVKYTSLVRFPRLIGKGHWNGQAMFFEKCQLLCDGTGWLRERPADGGYTGINIFETEAKTEGGKLEIKDLETGKWETLG